MAKHVQQLRSISDLLQTSYQVPGTQLRIGLDTPIGRVPAVGALAHAAVGAYALAVAVQARAPPLLLLRMTSNLVVGSGLRAIPLLGPWVGPRFKASDSNVRLLEQHLRLPPRTPSSGVAAPGGRSAAPAPDVNAVAKSVDGRGEGETGALFKVPRLLWGVLAVLVAVPVAAGFAFFVACVYLVLHLFGAV